MGAVVDDLLALFVRLVEIPSPSGHERAVADFISGYLRDAGLDPSEDEARWERSIDALVTRALAERRHRLSIEQQLLRWARPVLAVAAGLSIVAWSAGYFSPPKRKTSLPSLSRTGGRGWSSVESNLTPSAARQPV